MAVPMATQRIEVITGREARRRYSDEEKLGLVEAAFAPGVRRAEFARRSGVDQSLLYRWRWQMFGKRPAIAALSGVG
jgi:transposase